MKTDKRNINYSLASLTLLISIGLSACGGGQNNSSSTQINTTDTNHPVFLWSKVAVSTKYAPSGKIKNKTPTFTWPAVNNAISYQLGHEDAVSSMRWTEYLLSKEEANCVDAGTKCYFKPTDLYLTEGDQKAWWVRAKTSNGWKNWSEAHVFKVVSSTEQPEPPVVISAEPISPNGDITLGAFIWTPGNGATEYQVGIENLASFYWRSKTLTAEEANCNSTECTTTINTEVPFTINEQYAWWIRAKINNQWTNWSNGMQFRVLKLGSIGQDQDQDGIEDNYDNCITIKNNDQRDSDLDGFGNACDADLDNDGFVSYADLTLFKSALNTSSPYADLDGNGIVNTKDYIIFKQLFNKVPGPSSFDKDQDGINDQKDNCLGINNTSQRDTDNDGFGNFCDADFDNDGFVSFKDLAFLKAALNTTNSDADLDGNGIVDNSDLTIFKTLFGKEPGPSAF